MSVNSYLRSLEKIKYLTNIAKLNFSKREEQIVFIASQLAKYVNYDIEHNDKSEEERIKLSSLQNCLDGRNTVCAGVAFAFERCMTELGIENTLVLGYSRNGNDNNNISKLTSNHVWNKVRINNNWYNIDVTNILNNLYSNENSKEKRIKTFILSSDKTLKNIGNIITDACNIPSSEGNFPYILELFNKVTISNNILEEFDNKKRSTFLKYNIHNNFTFPNKTDKTPEINIEKEQ